MKAIIFFLILLSLSGCSTVTALYESPNPGAISLGPREELRLHFGNPSSDFTYTDEAMSRVVQREYEEGGVAGRDRAIWLMGIWRF